MAGRKAKTGSGGVIPGKGKPGKTGGYIICPWSRTEHGVFAKQVELSPKGNLWAKCVCGVRIYAPKGHKVPVMKRKGALESGALIPDELEAI